MGWEKRRKEGECRKLYSAPAEKVDVVKSAASAENFGRG
jgi:hypothetical protein